ncbi:MAG: hypothetical protein M1823_001168 [Watsoniomyces obsoletus]|nr:MAG: hypothetical protein M1823_001168 [Watsoniomyces obsoletus]
MHLGNLVRLQPFQVSGLPAHPALEGVNDHAGEPASNGHPDVLEFAGEVLKQADGFMQGLYIAAASQDHPVADDGENNKPAEDPRAYDWIRKSYKTEAHTRINLFQRDINSADLHQAVSVKGPIPRRFSEADESFLKGEKWFARISTHEDAPKEGTASFDEMIAGLKRDHALHEQECTPTLYDTNKVLEWTIPPEAKVDRYYEIEMSIHEMCHRMPSPLQDRVFPVLIISAMSSPDSFIDVQLCLGGLEQVPGARNVLRKDVVVGAYTSVEAGRRSDGRTTWSMAVASDAKGILPSWLQAPAIPSAIAKDVGFFMEWAKNRRAKA